MPVFISRQPVEQRFKVTVAVGPLPFAWYMNESEAKPGFGVYTNVPSAFRVKAPCVGGVVTLTLNTPRSFAITPFDGSDTVSGVHGVVGQARTLYESSLAAAPGSANAPVLGNAEPLAPM